MKKTYCSIIFCFVSLSSLYAQKDCKLKKDLDSIKVYTCHNDTSRFKSIVAEFTLHTTLDQLAQFVFDTPNYTTWQFNTIEAQTIRKISSSEQIYHTVIEAPWPVIDRDMVVRMRIQRSDQNMVIHTESEEGILPRKELYVRVPSSRGMWIVKEKNKNILQIKYTMQIDPGGAVPSWLVNWVCAQAPYESFKNLKAILENKKLIN
jgi:hypothetical protein